MSIKIVKQKRFRTDPLLYTNKAVEALTFDKGVRNHIN
nr:MAG TPA: hypothetical protein [Caudoviricetes sp.]